MKRRLFGIFLALSLVLGLLAGCGKTGGETEAETEKRTKAETSAEKTAAAETRAETQAPESSAAPETAPEASSEEKTEPVSEPESSREPETAPAGPTEAPPESETWPEEPEEGLFSYGCREFRLVVTDLEEDKDGFTKNWHLNCRLENRTDRDIDWLGVEASVNGYMLNTQIFETVDAGETMETYLDIYGELFNLIDLKEPTEIEVRFRVEDSYDCNAAPFFDQVVQIFPDGEAPGSAYEIPDRPWFEDERCTFDNGDVSFYILKEIESYSFGREFLVYMENTLEYPLKFSWEQVGVCGYAIDPYFSETVAAGKRALSTVSFSQNELDLCGIGDFDELCYQLLIRNSEDDEAAPLEDRTYYCYLSGVAPTDVVYPERPHTETEQVIIDNAQFTFVILGTEIEEEWGTALLNVYFENKTDRHVTFFFDDTAVNGKEFESYWAVDVPAGLRLVKSILVDRSVTGEFKDLKKLDFTLKAEEADSRETLMKKTGFSYAP